MRKLIALALLGVFLVGCSSKEKVKTKNWVAVDSNVASETEVSDEDSTSETEVLEGDSVIETLETLDDTSNLNIDQSILDKLNALNEPYTLAEDTYTYTDIPDKSLTQPYFDLLKSEYGIDIRHPNFIDFKYKQGKLYFDDVTYF